MDDVRERPSIGRRLALPAVLAAAGLAFLLTRIGQVPSIYDEGLTLVGADRLLLGEVPFKDFWHTHPPGYIWLTAGVFRLVGESMMALRMLDALLKVVLALSVWGWVVRLGRPRATGVAFVVALLWLECLGIFGYAGVPALLCGLESLAFVVRSLAATSARRTAVELLGAGFAAGVGALFRLDYALYTAVAAGSTLVLAHSMTEGLPARRRLRGAVRGLALFAAGLGAPVLLLALLVVVGQGATLSRVYNTLVLYPAVTFPEVRRLPRPAFSWDSLAFYVPAWAGVLGLAHGLVLLRRGGRESACALAWCGLSLWMLAAVPQARTRADVPHQLPVVVTSVALVAAGWHELFRRGARWRASALALLPVVALVYLVQPARSWLRPLPGRAERRHGLSRAAGVALAPDQAAAVRAVRVRTEPGDFVFVGNGRNDRTVANDALFYFLAARRYPTFYHNMLPGLTTRDAVQREIVSDLEDHGVRVVVLCTAFDGVVEPNASRAAGSSELDAFIHRAFVPAATIGRYQIRVRE